MGIAAANVVARWGEASLVTDKCINCLYVR